MRSRSTGAPATIGRVLDLSDKTVLITGASKGIGAATASALGAAGASVIAHYGSDEAGAREATREIPSERKHLIRLDLSRPAAGRAIWRSALRWRSPIDVVVINAATMLETPLDATDGEWDTAWRQILRVNVVEAASLMRGAVGHFCEQGGGILITLSSSAAQRGASSPTLGGYAASKAAVKAMTQTIASAYAGEGVLAYLVAPGVVRTRMSEAAAADLGGEAAVTARLPMRSWVPPAEIGDLVALLATGRCRHLSGATLDMNGANYIR